MQSILDCMWGAVGTYGTPHTVSNIAPKGGTPFMIIFFPFSLTATPLKNFGGTYDAIRYLPVTRVPKAPHQADTVSALKNLSTMSAFKESANGTLLGTAGGTYGTTSRSLYKFKNSMRGKYPIDGLQKYLL